MLQGKGIRQFHFPGSRVISEILEESFNEAGEGRLVSDGVREVEEKGSHNVTVQEKFGCVWKD